MLRAKMQGEVLRLLHSNSSDGPVEARYSSQLPSVYAVSPALLTIHHSAFAAETDQSLHLAPEVSHVALSSDLRKGQLWVLDTLAWRRFGLNAAGPYLWTDADVNDRRLYCSSEVRKQHETRFKPQYRNAGAV